MCTFCNMAEETLDHLFWNCMIIQHFWNNLFNFINAVHPNIDMDKNRIYFGYESYTITYITTSAKYYIFCCKCTQSMPEFKHFKQKLTKNLKLEKFLALQRDKLDDFNTTWDIFGIT